MPTKRSRIERAPVADISDAVLYRLTDGLMGEDEPLSVDERFLNPPDWKALWLEIRDEVLPEWIRRYPGTRPSLWYQYDPECPRVSDEDIRRHGWEGWHFVPEIPDLRKRVGGIGTPVYECLAYTPEFHCAVPTHFLDQDLFEYFVREEEGGMFPGVPIDLNDPPLYESQASYLARHGLLTASERRRLTAKDFEP